VQFGVVDDRQAKFFGGDLGGDAGAAERGGDDGGDSAADEECGGGVGLGESGLVQGDVG